MSYEDTTPGSAQQDAFQSLGGHAGPAGVPPGPDTYWECGPHTNAWKGHDARCRLVSNPSDEQAVEASEGDEVTDADVAAAKRCVFDGSEPCPPRTPECCLQGGSTDLPECTCRVVGVTRDPCEPHIPAQTEWEQADDCPLHPVFSSGKPASPEATS